MSGYRRFTIGCEYRVIRFRVPYTLRCEIQVVCRKLSTGIGRVKGLLIRENGRTGYTVVRYYFPVGKDGEPVEGIG